MNIFVIVVLSIIGVCIIGLVDLLVSYAIEESRPERFSYFPLTNRFLDTTHRKGFIKHTIALIITVVTMPLALYRFILFILLYVFLIFLDIFDVARKK